MLDKFCKYYVLIYECVMTVITIITLMCIFQSQLIFMFPDHPNLVYMGAWFSAYWLVLAKK